MRRKLDKKLQKWCWYCGDQLTRRTKSRDHQVPKSRGGAGITDIVDCCKPCNTEKAAMTVEEFRWYRFGCSDRLFYGEKIMDILKGDKIILKTYET